MRKREMIAALILAMPFVLLAQASVQNYTVGASGVTQYTLVEQDSSGNVVPAVGLSGEYVGIAQATVPAGQVVPVSSGDGQLSSCQFDGAPVVGDIVIESVTSPDECSDAGSKSLGLVQARSSVIGVVQAVSATVGIVRQEGLGVYGSAGFVTTSTLNNQAFAGSIAAPSLNTGQINNIFYVSGYAPSGIHTAYDMARQAADAAAAANPSVGSVLILSPGPNSTCDAVPLPSLGTSGGTSGTTSIIGWGSGVSSLLKQSGCVPGAATLSHGDSPQGVLSSGQYIGFRVDANHIDAAGCEIYGMQLTTFEDVWCGNSIGGDHQWEFGNRDANNIGWADNIYAYGIHTYDYVGGGKGGILAPQWTAGSLTGLTVLNGGTKSYSTQYTRATLIGPDVASCTSLPTLTPTVAQTSPASFSNLPAFYYGALTGATITNPGNCVRTARIYVLLQDGIPNLYGFKFTNMSDSNLYDVEATGAQTYGEYISDITSANNFYHEHPYTNQTVQISDNGTGNSHVGAQFDSPGQFAFAMHGPNGSVTDSVIEWDGASYLGSSAFYAPEDRVPYTNWDIDNFQCAGGRFISANPYFQLLTNQVGPLSSTNGVSPGIYMSNAQLCDGTNAVINSLGTSAATADGTNFTFRDGIGMWFNTANVPPPGYTDKGVIGIHQDLNGNNMLWLKNTTSAAADTDGFGIDALGQVALSVPMNGDVVAQAMAAPTAPTVFTAGTPGSTAYAYYCTAVSLLGAETAPGAAATIMTGGAVLSTTNYNVVVCPFVEGFKYFNVYRGMNGAGLPTGYVGGVSKVNYERNRGFEDTGMAASVYPASGIQTGSLGIKKGNFYIALSGAPNGKYAVTLPNLSGYALWGQTASVAAGDLVTGSSTAGLIQDSGIALSGLMTAPAKSVATLQAGTNVSSVLCLTSTCTNLRGMLAVKGGTATTGVIASLGWTATPTVYVCSFAQNGGAFQYGVGSSAASLTGVNVTSANSVAGATLTISYACQP